MRCKIILFIITILTLIPGMGITGEIEWVKYPACLDLASGTQVSHPAVVFAGNRYHLWYAAGKGISYAKSTDGVVWEEYPSNPVLIDGHNGDWDGDSVSQPSVVYDGAMYRMWFTGYDGSTMRIGYATSTDGVVWHKQAGNPVLDLGTSSGSFDDAGVSGATVLYDGTMYRMWFTGYDGDKMRIGYATSTDGVVWNKFAGSPVLDLGASGNFDDEGVSSPSVVFDGTLYQMWFTGYDGDTMRVGYATSTDGLLWHLDAANPVLFLGVNSNLDNEGVSSPSVLYDGILYRMWYSGYDGNTIKIGYAIGVRPSPAQLTPQIEWVKYPANLNSGTDTSHPSVLSNGGKYHLWYAAGNGINYAKSTDGVVWEEYPSNPVLTDGYDSTWDGDSVSQPSVIYDGAMYRMWFTGYDGSKIRIGYATSTDGVVWSKYAGNPVMDPGTNGSFDDTGVSGATVLYDGAVYRMWFTGYDGKNLRIGYATSIDGTVWNKYGVAPVLNLGVNGAWDDEGVSSPCVLFDGILYHLLYTGYDGACTSIGYAVSINGVMWNKAENINPVLGLGTNDCWDDTGVSSPSILYDGRLCRLFYTGYDGSNTRLGYATAQNMSYSQLTRVTIDSADATVEMSGIQSFTAHAFDQYSYPIAGATYTWTLKTAGMGTLNTTTGQTVVFTATKTGTVDLQVVAGFGTRTATATARITIVDSVVHHINITPATATLGIGGTQSFTATGYNQYGSVIPGLVFDWQTTIGSLSATIGSATTFTAGTQAITGTLTAGTQSIVGYTTITITPGPVDQLIFVPLIAGTLTVGMAGAMTVQTQDGFGNPAAANTTIVVSGDEQSMFAEAASTASWTASGTFTIAGTSSRTFLFKQNRTTTPAGSVIITASITGTSISATHSVTIQPLGNSSSGTIQADDGQTRVDVGTGALQGEGCIEIDTSGTSTDWFVGEANKADDLDTTVNRIEGSLRQFTPQGIAATFTATVIITIPYLDTDNDGRVDGTRINEMHLSIYHLEGTEWVRVEGSMVDPAANTVSAPVSHFSYYILMGAGFEPNLEKALVYPNPFHADRHTLIYFDCLSQNTTIRIFTIAGELVREIPVTSSLQKWDTCNSAGEKVASGIYIYLIKDTEGNRKSGKLGVIR